jgi:cation:H+ antiporter
MSLSSIAIFAAGVVILVVGAEFLVRGASGIAARTGLSSIVIGLTVVAFGTSTPELAVSVQSALDGQADIAVGNVVGSNIANVLLVLGLSAVVGGGLLVAQRIVRLDVPLMVLVSAATWVMALDGSIGMVDGILLVTGLVVYTTWTVIAARRPDAAATAEYDEAFEPDDLRAQPMWFDLGSVLLGLVALVGGARLLVSAATDIALDLGIPELVIGLTIVAVGTSAPEIATSVVAAIRGERDIAVGNAIGSNLFNLMGVLGLSAIVAPTALAVSESARTLDIPVMTAVAVACLPVFFDGHSLRRWEGYVFLAYYVAYVVYLVLDGTDHQATDELGAAMGLFVLPLTLLTLAVVGVRTWRRHRAGSPAAATD